MMVGVGGWVSMWVGRVCVGCVCLCVRVGVGGGVAADDDKEYRIERLMVEEKERMEIARQIRQAKRKEALAALGLV